MELKNKRILVVVLEVGDCAAIFCGRQGARVTVSDHAVRWRGEGDSPLLMGIMSRARHGS